eukprot:TRINITY_DN115186_c0_g1_i1.p1 TRINITY_DN115186_c0_g1~~TRINITY_DN115186_c0_g1_i1.p1  ORF type:complete len:377 (-),score=47.56 TRINITY_DN115186_c0_g1_i1:399-1472(-)
MYSNRLGRLLLACTFTFAACETDRPIIGILTQPLGTEGKLLKNITLHNKTYIAASYVKFIEAAGARVVPIPFEGSAQATTTLFNQLNGVLFPGGGTGFTKWASQWDPRFRNTATLLLNLTIEANRRGDVFPLHGTCLGLEMLANFIADDDAVICHRCFDTFGVSMALNATEYFPVSKMFMGMPESLVKAVQTENLTENSHRSGVAVESFRNTSSLSEFFSVSTVNTDPHGREFVSTMEAKNYPITATQWHPEKNNFEWERSAISHTLHAVQLSQWVANNFVEAARKSSHRFATPEDEAAALIYNSAPIPDPQHYYTQIYMWDMAASEERGSSPIQETAAKQGPFEATNPVSQGAVIV